MRNGRGEMPLQPEICNDLLHWKGVFCILSPVSKIGIELIDFERDEDFSMHKSCT